MKNYDFSSLLAAISLIDEMSVEDAPFSPTRLENHRLNAENRRLQAEKTDLTARLKLGLVKADFYRSQAREFKETIDTRPLHFVPTMESRLRNYIDPGQKGQH